MSYDWIPRGYVSPRGYSGVRGFYQEYDCGRLQKYNPNLMLAAREYMKATGESQSEAIAYVKDCSGLR